MISLGGGLSLRSTESNQTQTRGLVFSEPDHARLFGPRASHAAVSYERLTLRRRVAPSGIVARNAGRLLRRRAHPHATRDRQAERASALPTVEVCHAGDRTLRSTGAARRRCFRRRGRAAACSNACGAHRKREVSDEMHARFPQFRIAVNVEACSSSTAYGATTRQSGVVGSASTCASRAARSRRAPIYSLTCNPGKR